MGHTGKIQLTYVIIAPKDQVAEGKRLFAAHEPWMKSSHHRTGAKALLGYSVSVSPELTNPMDRTSAPTGNTVFILSETYETVAGVDDHFEQGSTGWSEFPALGAWLGKCKMVGAPAAEITHSLW